MKRLVAMLFLLWSSACAFADGVNYAGAQFGSGEIEVNRRYSVGDRHKESIFGWSGFFGHKFGPGIIVESGLLFYTSDDLFGSGDTYDLYRGDLLLGYEFRFAEDFRLTPKIGVNRARLVLRDDAFLSFSDDQDGSQEISYGNNAIWVLAGEYRITDFVQLVLSHDNVGYDFGRAEITRFGVKFEF
jgi:hypothetical protein